MTRLFGFVSILVVLGASGYAVLGGERVSKLNPVTKVSQGEARADLASAQYTLAIVSVQLAQVARRHRHVRRHARLRQVPARPARRADESSYCMEFQKTQTFFLTGPGGAVVPGPC